MATKADFAYTPTDSESDWKLNISDAAHVGGAAAALGAGYRGQKVEIPADARAGVVAKVRAAWKRFHPDADPDEMPEALKAAEADPYSHSHMHTHPGMDDPHDHLHQHSSANHDDATHAHGHADSMEMDQPTPQDVHVNVPLGSKKKSPKDELDDKDEEMGSESKPEPVEKDGKVKKIKNPIRVMGEAFARFFQDWYGAGMPGGDASSTNYLPDSSLADDGDDDNDADDGAQPKLEKADDRVNYRDATDPKVSCLTCRFFLSDDGACRIVEGYIAPISLCNLQAAVVPLMASEEGAIPYHILSRRLRFSGAPEWIPFMPKPGTYTHPSYGKIDLTRARLDRFAENFKAHVYGQSLPLDAEHESKVSGAVGWVKALRQNENGSIDAKVEWNDRGRAFLEGDRFRYFSPEWFDEWVDPVSGKKYKDIVIGGAICTRPFFKEGSLRALAASDPTLAVRGIFTGRTPTLAPPPQSPPIKGDTSVGMTEQEVKEFTETRDQLRQLIEANKAKDVLIESARAEAKSAREQAQTITASARRQRFTDHIRGKSDSNGHRWFGEIEPNVTLLEKLADTFGEDSDDFKGYLARQDAQAAQLAASELFQERGRDAAPASGSIEAKVFAEVERRTAQDPKADPTDVMAAYFAENPQAYEEYRAKNTQKV